MRIVFAGTPDFAVPSLRALLAGAHQVIAVYTQPDRRAGRGRGVTASPVKQVAVEHGIMLRQPAKLTSGAPELQELQPDLMVVVAYGLILPQPVLDVPVNGCINVHASLLPRWRGAAPIQRALEAGDEITGVSIMRMEAGLDTGPVLHTLSTEITADDTAQSLHDRLAELGAEALMTTLRALAEGRAVAVSQDPARACYAAKLDKREAPIDWSQPAAVLERRVRAFNPWPGCETRHRGNRLRILNSEVAGAADRAPTPGTVTSLDRGAIEVACGQGSLRLTRLQRDGAKALDADAFLRGYRIDAGERLG